MYRRHKTIAKEDSDRSLGLAHRTIARELELAHLDYQLELDWNEVALPLTPADVLSKYEKYLTEFERKEILEFEQIYFIGHRAHKVKTDVFDNNNNEYKYVLNDHIAYRY